MTSNTLHDTIEEAKRQSQICNACRYCEGFCAVFPAIQRQRSLSHGDVNTIANLCHNCRGCYHACQYTAPHEFKINIPAVLAEVRTQSWQAHIKPAKFAALFQRSGAAIALLLVVCIAALFLLIQLLPNTGGSGFYQYLSHTVMISIFIPCFLAPLFMIGLGIKHYWQTIGGEKVKANAVLHAFKSAATMKNLSGGQGQGCQFEDDDRYSNKRKWLHQLAMFGFLLCFASTSCATIMHYALNIQAPYPLLSVPKILGISGGLALVIGSFGLAGLKLRADSALGDTNTWGAEMAFSLLLGLTGLTGLLLVALTDTAGVPLALAVHLGCVLSLFLLMPYSKMVHGFFRLAALIRDAQIQLKAQP